MMITSKIGRPNKSRREVFPVGTETGRLWYLVRTKPRSEYIAQKNLVRQGYLIYLPEIRATRRRNGRLVPVVVPMFPRYLFVRLSEKVDSWAPVSSTIGVSNIIYFGQNAARVPDSLIEELMCREDKDGVYVLPAEEYKPGSSVRIAVGGLIGCEGIFQAKEGKDRALILLHILGRHIQTRMSLGQLGPVVN